MLLTIPAVIDKQQLQILQGAMRSAHYVDGKLSAGAVAGQVKRNQEMDQQSETALQLSKITIGNLYQNPQFRLAALPLRVATPYFARYTQGMGYGFHIDDPVMGDERGRFRCDVACTVYINGPEDYDGGELVIRTTFGEQKIKLAAGAAVLYPASSLHQVAEVTRGERLVAVTWIQSMVRDPARREILYELGQAREQLLHDAPHSVSSQQVDHAYTNLIRQWSEV